MASYLNAWDYGIICATLILSIFCGLYHGYFRAKQSTFFEYFLGSRNMPMFPVVISSFATITAAGLMLGFPVEIYQSGIQTIFTAIAFLVLIPIINYFVAPTFIQLQSGNIFEFYEIRYNKTLKNVITFVYILIFLIFSSVQIYGPATALSLVTGIHVWIIISTITSLCLIYTVFGGMRAVVFADTVQGLQMLLSLVILLIVGTVTLGGIDNVWTNNIHRKDIKVINFSMDLTITHTFWSDAIAWTVTYICFVTVNQSIMQRVMACPTLQEAQKMNTLSMTITTISYCSLVYLGMLIFATFNQCDPLTSGQISNNNQLVPFYIMKTFRGYPGLPGLYFASILSASLSTLSSAINSWAAISVESFILPKNPNISEVKRTNICKILSFVFGILALSGVLLIQLFPNVLQAAVVIAALVTCPLFALFTIGVCCPRANRKGCIIAFITSVFIGVWLIAGLLVLPNEESQREFSTIGCSSDEMIQKLTFRSYIGNQSAIISYNLNMTSEIQPDQDFKESIFLSCLFPFGRISYLWIGFIIYWLSVLLCIVLTYILGKEECDKQFIQYIPPVVKRCYEALPFRIRPYLLCDLDATSEEEISEESTQLTPLISQHKSATLYTSSINIIKNPE